MASTAEQRRYLGAIWIRWHADHERCALCGFARIHVSHHADREHSPLGPRYYAEADVPYCPFLPTGTWVDGYDRVTGYIPLDEAQRLASGGYRSRYRSRDPGRRMQLSDAACN